MWGGTGAARRACLGLLRISNGVPGVGAGRLRTPRLHLLRADVDQLLDILGRHFFARPRLFPARLGLRDGLNMVAVLAGLGGRAGAVFRLEDVLEERHPGAARGTSERARLHASRATDTGRRGCGVLGSTRTDVTDAGSTVPCNCRGTNGSAGGRRAVHLSESLEEPWNLRC
jgi:hypothetical protein